MNAPHRYPTLRQARTVTRLCLFRFLRREIRPPVRRSSLLGNCSSTDFLRASGSRGCSARRGRALVQSLRVLRCAPESTAAIRAERPAGRTHFRLFTRATIELTPAVEYSDEEADWNDAGALEDEPSMFATDGWSWHGPPTIVRGPAWGGSLEMSTFTCAPAATSWRKIRMTALSCFLRLQKNSRRRVTSSGS